MNKENRSKSDYIWLGITDSNKENTFVDNDGVEISWDKWKNGEPDDHRWPGTRQVWFTLIKLHYIFFILSIHNKFVYTMNHCE